MAALGYGWMESISFQIIGFHHNLLHTQSEGRSLQNKSHHNQSFYQGWVDNYFQTRHMYAIHTYLVCNSSWLQKGQWKHLIKWHLLSKSGWRIHSLIPSWQKLTKGSLSHHWNNSRAFWLSCWTNVETPAPFCVIPFWGTPDA